MRVALISDLHGNLVSLEAVIADVERSEVDAVVCLGDVADLGPLPRETVARVRDLGCPRIVGNHDPFDGPMPGPPQVQAWHDWAEAALDPEDVAFLREGHATLDVPLGDGAVLHCVHGSPRSYDEQLLPWTPEADLDAMLADVGAVPERVAVAAGHTHIQMLRHHAGRAVLNAGSVGAPFERPFDGRPPRLKPWAEYAVVGWHDGTLAVELRQVPVDVEALLDSIRASAMPMHDVFLSQWATTEQLRQRRPEPPPRRPGR